MDDVQLLCPAERRRVLKCPVCSFEHVDDPSFKHTGRGNAPRHRCSHGATMVFIPADCPVCQEDQAGPPTIALTCGHVLCPKDFKELGGSIGVVVNGDEQHEEGPSRSRTDPRRSDDDRPPGLPPGNFFTHHGFPGTFRDMALLFSGSSAGDARTRLAEYGIIEEDSDDDDSSDSDDDGSLPGLISLPRPSAPNSTENEGNSTRNDNIISYSTISAEDQNDDDDLPPLIGNGTNNTDENGRTRVGAPTHDQSYTSGDLPPSAPESSVEAGPTAINNGGGTSNTRREPHRTSRETDQSDSEDEAGLPPLVHPFVDDSDENDSMGDGSEADEESSVDSSMPGLVTQSGEQVRRIQTPSLDRRHHGDDGSVPDTSMNNGGNDDGSDIPSLYVPHDAHNESSVSSFDQDDAGQANLGHPNQSSDDEDDDPLPYLSPRDTHMNQRNNSQEAGTDAIPAASSMDRTEPTFQDHRPNERLARKKKQNLIASWLGARVRGYLARINYRRLLASVLKMQSWARMLKVRRVWHTIVQERVNSHKR